jgi:ammonia channel protein AmtB
VIVKNLIVVCFGTICWWLCGFSLTFCEWNLSVPGITPATIFAGTSVVDVVGGINATDTTTVLSAQDPLVDFETLVPRAEKTAVWFVLNVLAILSIQISSRCAAERSILEVELWLVFIMVSIIFPVVLQWTHCGTKHTRWLSNPNFIGLTHVQTFGSEVHVIAGVCGLVWTLWLAPRNERFQLKVRGNTTVQVVKNLVPHDIVFSTTGIVLYCAGSFALHSATAIISTFSRVDLDHGELSHIDDADISVWPRALQAIFTTVCASAVGGLAAAVISNYHYKVSDLHPISYGIISGVVSVSAFVGEPSGWATFVVPLLGAVVQSVGSAFLRRYLVDDPSDTIATHGFVGMLSSVAAAFVVRGRTMRDDGMYHRGILSPHHHYHHVHASI